MPLVRTRAMLTPVSGETKIIFDDELPDEPTYEQLRRIVGDHLDGGYMERVHVLARLADTEEFRPHDMFVGESGHRKELPRNEIATAHYRRWSLRCTGCGNVLTAEEFKAAFPNALTCCPERKKPDPESVPFVVGPAVLFDRPVWF